MIILKKYTTILAILAICQSCQIFDGNVIKPVLSSDLPNTSSLKQDTDIYAFFDKYLMRTFYSECFFVEKRHKYIHGDGTVSYMYVNDPESKYVVINSMDELRANCYDSSIELPTIDFDIYTYYWSAISSSYALLYC